MKKVVKALAAVIITIMLFAASGCWDAHELDTLAIVTAVAVDTVEGSDDLLFSFQIGKVEQAAGGSGTKGNGGEDKPYVIMQAEEKGLMYAINTLRNKNSRQLFLHHNQVIILGREVAEKGITEILDAFIREHQMRSEIWVIVADGKAEELLTSEMDQDKISGLGINSLMEDLRKISEIYDVNLQNFIANVISPTDEPIAPMIRTVKRENCTEFDLFGFAVFKDEKMVGEFGLKEARGFSWIKDYLKDLTNKLVSEEGYAIIKMSNFHTDLKPEFTPDGKPLIKLKISCNFELVELQGYKNMKMEEIGTHLEQVAKDTILDEVNSAVTYCQGLDSDIFGFGSEYHRHYQKKWKTLKDKWPELYKELKVETEVEATFLDEGKIQDILGNVKQKAKEGKK